MTVIAKDIKFTPAEVTVPADKAVRAGLRQPGRRPAQRGDLHRLERLDQGLRRRDLRRARPEDAVGPGAGRRHLLLPLRRPPGHEGNDRRQVSATLPRVPPRRPGLRPGPLRVRGRRKRLEQAGRAAGVPEHDASGRRGPRPGRARRARPAPWPCRSGSTRIPSVRASRRVAASAASVGAAVARPELRRRALDLDVRHDASPSQLAEPGDQRARSAVAARRAAWATATPRTRGRRRPPCARPTRRPACVPPVADGTTTSSRHEPARRGSLDQLHPRQHLADGADHAGPADADHVRAPAGGSEVVDDLRRPAPRVRRGRPVAAWWTVAPSSSLEPEAAGSADRSAGPDRTRWTGSPARAPAAAVSRAWFDQRRPGGDQAVGALGQRRADQELQVSQLVAAERERQQVLALDPDLDAAAERGREARQRLAAATGPSSSGTRGNRSRVRRPGGHAPHGTRLVSSADGHSHPPGRPAHHDRPAPRAWSARSRSPRRPSARDRLYSSIVSTAPGDRTRIHHHGECETSIYILSGAAQLHVGPDRASSTPSTRPPATSSTSRPARSTSRRTRRRREPLVVVLTRNCPDSHVVYLDGGPDGADDVPAPC